MNPKLKKGMAILLVFAMLFSLVPATAFAADSQPEDTRTVVSNVAAVSNSGDITPEYGKQATNPTFTVTEGKPAHLESVGWGKMVGGIWDWTVMAEGDTFGEGTYRYRARLRIDDKKFDGNDKATHVLAKEGLILKVDGKDWEVGSVSIRDGISYVMAFSPVYTVTAPGEQALTFHGSTTFDIGKNYVGRAITSYSVAGNVEGGTQPYTFSKVSGPAWIAVSAAGEISGIPTAAGENADLVVQVTDSNSAAKTITIEVADTKINPDDRTEISAVTATSDINPKYGEQATKPTFTITEGKPAWLGGNDWWKMVDGEWTEMAANDIFGEGAYRYRAQLRIDSEKFDGDDGTTHVLAKEGLTLKVDEKDWEVGSVSIYDDVSFVGVFSPEFTVTKPVIQAISIKGITAPVAGETADVSGIDTANKGITLGEKQWYKVNKDSSMTKMGASDKFVANQTYYLVIPYTVSEDYTVSERAEILHDLTGGIAKHDSSAKTIVIEYTVPETYTVTVTTDGNGTAEASVTRTAAGTKVTLTATPNDGYEFDKWEVTPPRGGIVLVTDNSFVMPAGAVTVKAIFKEKAVTPATYTVKFYANYGSGTMNPVTVTAGEYTLPECGFTAPEGQRFKAWRINGGDEYAAGETITISQDSYAVAQWEPIPNPILNTINIKGITAPVAGETAVTTGITTDTEGIAVKTVQWLTDASIVLTSQKFEAGETYYLFIRFETDIYHKVSDRAAFIHDLTNGTLNHIDNTDATSPWIKIEYTVPGGTPKTPVESVKISDVTKPVIGATPDFDITLIGEGAALDKYEDYDAIVWYKYKPETDEWESLDEDTTFGTGFYALEVYLKAEDGYEFTDATKFYYNDYELPAWHGTYDSCYDLWGDGEYVDILLYFTLEESAAPTEITSLSATVTAPEAGASPSFEAAVGGEGYTAELEWEIVAEETIIYPEDNHKFKAGEEYGLWVVFIPKDGYEFADDVTITINGMTPEDTYEYEGKIVGLVTYTLPAATPITYTVSFDSNGGTGTMADVTGISNEYTLPACGFTAPSGQQFKAWSVGGREYEAGKNIYVAENTTVTAVWEKSAELKTLISTINIKGIIPPVAGELPVFTGITTDTPGITLKTLQWLKSGSVVMNDRYTFESGVTYTFYAEYDIDEENYKLVDSVTAKHDLAGGVLDRINTSLNFITIKYTVPDATASYTVSFDSNGGSDVTVQTIEAGQKATKPANPTREGYDFKGWTLDGVDYDFGSAVTGNIELVAKWEAVHTHTYATEWTYDKTSHWHKATCGHDVIADKEAHNYGTDRVCDTCNYKKPSSGGGYGGGSYVAPDKTPDYDLRIVMQINNKNILVNGVTKVNDVAPVIVGDRTLVPIRVVTELLGGSADWDNDTRTVTLKIDGKTMNMTIGKEIPGFGTSAVIMNDRTYVPVRYVMEMLGAKVTWIAATQQIIIEK
ncbi:MAG: InlB B-repeat-containing protein [Peptococcaceae bacterium]|nr:InlB B-repeat-containing protein [Peptococcaceae bacterium]